MSAQAHLAALPALLKYATEHKFNFYPEPPIQGLTLPYFKGKWDLLPDTLNWKPYWGENEVRLSI